MFNKRIKALEKLIENLEEKQTAQTFDFGKITFSDLARIVEAHISGAKTRKKTNP